MNGHNFYHKKSVIYIDGHFFKCIKCKLQLLTYPGDFEGTTGFGNTSFGNTIYASIVKWNSEFKSCTISDNEYNFMKILQ